MAEIKSEWRDILQRVKCRLLQEDLQAIKEECDDSIQRKEIGQTAVVFGFAKKLAFDALHPSSDQIIG